MTTTERNPSLLGEGGLSVATVGDKNPYEPYFGPLHLNNNPYKYQDPTQHRPVSVRNLPDAYAGRCERLLSLIEEQVIMNSDFLVKKVIPAKETDEMHFSWNEWKFNNSLLAPVPYQGVSRLLSNETSENRKSTIRYGIAFMLEYEFMNTPEGRLNYEYNLRSIAHAVNETNYFDILKSIISSNKDIEDWTSTNGYYSSKSFEDIMEAEKDGFATLQKHKNAFEKLDAMVTDRMSFFGGTATLWLMEPALKYYCSLVPPEKTDYYLAGEEGPKRVQNASANFNDSNPNLVFGNGVTVYLVRPFNYDNHPNLSAMQRRRSIGEMITMFPLMSTDPTRYNKTERDVLDYNEDKDKWHLFTLDTAISNCCLFQPRPGPQGLCMLDDNIVGKGPVDDRDDDQYNPFLMDSSDPAATSSMARSTAVSKIPIQVYGHLSEEKYESKTFLEVATSIKATLSTESVIALEKVMTDMEAVMNMTWVNDTALKLWILNLTRNIDDAGNVNNMAGGNLEVFGPFPDRYVKGVPHKVLIDPLVKGTPINDVVAAGNPTADPERIVTRIGSTNFTYWSQTRVYREHIAPLIAKLQHLLPNCVLTDPRLTSSDYKISSPGAVFFENGFGFSQFRLWLNPTAAAALAGRAAGAINNDTALIIGKFSAQIVANLTKLWRPIVTALANLFGNANEAARVGYYLGGLLHSVDIAEADIQPGDRTYLGYDLYSRVKLENRRTEVAFPVAGMFGNFYNYNMSLMMAQLFAMMLPHGQDVDEHAIRAAIESLLTKLYRTPAHATAAWATTNTPNAAAATYYDVTPVDQIQLKGNYVVGGGGNNPALKSTNPEQNFNTIAEWVVENARLFNLANPEAYLNRRKTQFLQDLQKTKRYEESHVNSMLAVVADIPEQSLARIKGEVEALGAGANAAQRGQPVLAELIASFDNPSRIGGKVDMPATSASNMAYTGMVKTTVSLSTKQFMALYEGLFKGSTAHMLNPYITISSLENRDTPATFEEMKAIYNTLKAEQGTPAFKTGLDRFPQLANYVTDASKRSTYLSALGIFTQPLDDVSSKRTRMDDSSIGRRGDHARSAVYARKAGSALSGAVLNNLGIGGTSPIAKGPGNYLPPINERLANHWHNIHSIGSTAGLTQVLARCLLLTPFSKESLLNLYHGNCIVPVSFILARPHMEYNTSLAIKILPGERTGNLMVGHRDFQLGNNPKDKTFIGHFTIHFAPVIKQPKNIRVVYDVFSKQCLGGAGVTLWNHSNRQSYEPSAGKTKKASMFVFMVAYREDRNDELPNPMDVCGHFTYLDAPGLLRKDGEDRPHYSTAGVYNRLWRFRTRESLMTHRVHTLNLAYPFHENGRFRQSEYNTVVWQAGQGGWNHVSGKHDNLTANTGHWGPTGFGPGARKVRNGGLDTFKNSLTEVRQTISV